MYEEAMVSRETENLCLLKSDEGVGEAGSKDIVDISKDVVDINGATDG
jgi:hypothetical protein